MVRPVESLKDSATEVFERQSLGSGVSGLRRAVLSPEWENETSGPLVLEIGILLIFFTDLSQYGSDSGPASVEILGRTLDAVGFLLQTVGQGNGVREVQNLKRIFLSSNLT